MSKQPELKDNGTIKQFSTGAVREGKQGKGAYHLIPTAAIEAVAHIYEEGAKKRGDRNWEKGLPLSSYYDSGLRHWMQSWEGRTDERHHAQMLWNALGYVHTFLMIKLGLLPKELDDRPKNHYKEPKSNTIPNTNALPAPVLTGLKPVDYTSTYSTEGQTTETIQTEHPANHIVDKLVAQRLKDAQTTPLYPPGTRVKTKWLELNGTIVGGPVGLGIYDIRLDNFADATPQRFHFSEFVVLESGQE